MDLINTTDEKKIWDFLYGKIKNSFGVAGLMANLFAESGLISYRVQGDYQSGYLFSKQYTAQVDSGVISKDDFVYNAPNGKGYGLAQWTYWSRKKSLYDFCKSKNTSIGDLDMQLEFLYKELSEKFKSVLNRLQTANSVFQASNAVLFDFENPFTKDEKIQNQRASFGEKYYLKFATGAKVEGTNNMGYKNYNKKQSVKVSTHFNSTEFDCHGNGCCTKTIVNEKLIEYLEKIREHFNAPITITSAYRCSTHNRNVGGVTGSRHSKGDAADIVVKGVTPRTVAQYAESIGILGVGLYETRDDGFFVHIDTRDHKSFWYGQACAARTTFGGASASNSNLPNSNASSTILNRGDRGAAVKALQEKLIKLGYSCGKHGADGDFGTNTESAVIKFQKEHNLGIDGIVGYQTMTAIDKAVAEIDKTNSIKTVRVTASVLNVRQGAGTNYKIVGNVRKGTVCELTYEKDGWGKIKQPDGWISLNYCERT